MYVCMYVYVQYESSSSMSGRECLDYLRDCLLLKNALFRGVS
jgi:hypothetical protein